MKIPMGRSLEFILAMAMLLAIAEQKSILAAAAETNAPTSKTNAHDPRFDKTRDLILKRVGSDIPSFGISVMQGGKILWEESFGFADRAEKIVATLDKAYPISVLRGIG